MTPRVPPHLCRCLKTKAMFTQATADEADFTSFCWCVKTMTALGPDQVPAEAARCTSGRPCFEPQGEE